VTDRSVTANGIRLHVEEHGHGEPILLIHGTVSSALVWDRRSIERLAKLGRVIAYDRRGCFRSARPEPYERTSVAEQADDAAALLDALGAVPAIAIGRSYGGAIALDLAARFPDRVRALVLLEPALLHLSPDARRWEREVHRVVAEAAERGIDTVAEVFIGEVLGPDAWHGYSRDMKRMLTGNGAAIVAEFEGGPLDIDDASLAAIGTPTLLVSAAASPDVFREVADRAADAMPSVRRLVIEGDHAIDPADPDVLAFVREILSTAR
jgi:pimeloyl-ACP methyl ester carboxylesterase